MHSNSQQLGNLFGTRTSGRALITGEQMQSIFGRNFSEIKVHTRGPIKVYISKTQEGLYALNVFDERKPH
jgi:hypothetical protein